MNHLSALVFRPLCAITTILSLVPAPALAQPTRSPYQQIGVVNEIAFPPQSEISPMAEASMEEEIQHNIDILQEKGALTAPNSNQSVTYQFPLRLAPGLPDSAGFRVSAFVDHNLVVGQVMDYNGGARTYDNHHGTDFGLWPFAWNKLDAGEMQVVAAAAGTIIAYGNVNPADHNCGPNSTGNWNYVALVHADGRMTIYGHMRYNSLTPKGIGQTVAQGEYLGIAASSGNSSGPHLHFEVRKASFSTEWIDPYAGPNSQPESLWALQRPYIDSAINRLATHSAPPSTPDDCKPTVTHLQDSFTTPSTVYFYTYYRDYIGGLVTQFSVYRPDGSIFQTWQDSPIDNTFYSMAIRSKVIAFSNSDPAGTWRFEANYNGQTYATFFNINAPPVINLLSPNGGEQWDRSSSHAVKWDDNLGGDVNIALYHNGRFSATLATNIPGNGEYLWMPGAEIASSSGYSIAITSVNNSAITDISDSSFSLSEVRLTAQDDFAMTQMAMPITIDILQNDLKPAANPLTVTAVGSALHGVANLIGSQIRYTPTVDFLGQVVFTYTITTATESAEAKVTVLVAAKVERLFLPNTQRPSMSLFTSANNRLSPVSQNLRVQ